MSGTKIGLGLGHPGGDGSVVPGAKTGDEHPSAQKGAPDPSPGQRSDGDNSGAQANATNRPDRSGRPDQPGNPNKPNKADKPARAEELKFTAQQSRSRVDNALRSNRSQSDNGHGNDGGKLKGDAPKNSGQQENRLQREANELLRETNGLREQSGLREPNGNAYGWRRNQSEQGGRGEEVPFQSHDHGHDGDRGSGPLSFSKLKTSDFRDEAHALNSFRDDAHTSFRDDARALNSSVNAYLRGASDGADLPAEMRQAIDTASRLLGTDFIAGLEGRGAGGDKSFKFIEHALGQVNHALEKAYEQGGQVMHTPQEFVRAAVSELVEAAQLERYFRQLEKSGGSVVRQAAEEVARLLYGGRGEAGGGVEDGIGRRVNPGEILRDLRAGAFLPPEESYNPFPLTGRARVVTEMMELMRTLDAIERAAESLRNANARGEAVPARSTEAALLTLLRGQGASDAVLEALDKLLSALLPALPGRAGRLEALRLIAALNGMLTDAQGRLLLTKEGTALRLDQLLWLGSLGATSTHSSSHATEAFLPHLSPLLVYGFDAIYSVIGFDGRTLNPPHFAAVQSQVNGSELEWVFGQPPLSEGWMRALIERLKDSAFADHNLLGEMLEESLAEGRFHAVLVSGKVEQGEPVADSSAITRLLPGASVEAAFSTA